MSKVEGKPKKSKKKEEEPPKPLHVLCIISTTREGKIANRIAKLVEQQFDEHLKPKNKNHSFEIIGINVVLWVFVIFDIIPLTDKVLAIMRWHKSF